jgi:hypothetical protein
MQTKYLILIACSVFILLCIGLYFKLKNQYDSDSDSDSDSESGSIVSGIGITEGFVSKKNKKRAKKAAKAAAIRGVQFIPGIGQLFTIGKFGRKLFKWGKRARKAKRARAARKKLQAARRRAEEAKRRIDAMKEKYDRVTDPYQRAKEKYDSANEKYEQAKDIRDKFNNLKKKVEISYPEKFAIASYGLWWKAAELGEVKDRVLSEMPDKQKAYSEALERNLNLIKTSEVIKIPPNELTPPEKELWNNYLTPEEKAIYINAHPLGKYKIRTYLAKGREGINEIRNLKYDTTERI